MGAQGRFMSILKESDKPHILVVDDDDRLRSLLKKFLSEQGFIVSVAASTFEAQHLTQWFVFDLMVVDVMMPKQTGIDWLKKDGISAPVLMLSALGEAEDRIKGLEVGVEDYLSKPFEPKELVLRIKAILRRTGEQQEKNKWLTFGAFRFDPQALILKHHDASVSLTGSEAEMLKMLANHAGTAVSREKLATLLPSGSNERSVDVQITRLRKKIEKNDATASYIQTVRGAGYVLQAD